MSLRSAARAQKRRHTQLRTIAERLVSRQILSGALEPKYTATTGDVIALAFGRHQLTVDEGEAARYLEAARVEKGVTR